MLGGCYPHGHSGRSSVELGSRQVGSRLWTTPYCLLPISLLPQFDAVADDRYFVGSTAVAPLRSSKWSCGLVTEPVWPALAMTSPRLTVSPRLTNRSLLWA